MRESHLPQNDGVRERERDEGSKEGTPLDLRLDYMMLR